MTKSALVKIGVPPAEATAIRSLRRTRQILEQHDAALARLIATTQERLRLAVMLDDDGAAGDEDADPLHTATGAAASPAPSTPPS